MKYICNAHIYQVITWRIYTELLRINKKTMDNPINRETSQMSVYKRDNHMAKKH